MKKNIKTSIIINASPEKIWGVLINFNKYPTWNSFIKSIYGTPVVGNNIKVQLLDMTFTPTVLKFEKNKEFVWKGKLFLKGIFDGEHRFFLKDNNDGTTTFEHSESFNGLLVKLFAKKIDNDTINGFKAMNRDLKLHVEENIK